jgi:hypothetical protein
MPQNINLNDTTPAAPTGKANVKWQADAASSDPTVIRNASAYVDSACVRNTFAKTTASLAAGAVENGTITIGKSFTVLKLVVNRPARVRLYSTAAALTADASRLATVPPTAGAQHGVILDIVLNVTTGLTWILSPSADGSNLEASPSSAISYAITNNDVGAGTVTATFTCIVEEA